MSPVVRPFSQERGPTNPLPHSASPLEFFNQMFGVNFFGNLVAATNANAAAKRPPILNVYAIPTGIQRQLPRCRHLLESTLLWGWPTCRSNFIRITGQRNPYSIIHTWGRRCSASATHTPATASPFPSTQGHPLMTQPTWTWATA